MTSPEDICNLALSRISNLKQSVNDLEDPKTPIERAFALWYPVSRQISIKKLMPNFALSRDVVSLINTTPAFGYAYAYQYPRDCLKALGIGDVQDKENNFSVESGMILTDEYYEDGLPLRFIKDITDVSKFTPEFIVALTADLGEKIAMQITQDAERLGLINKLKTSETADAGALNGQENRPIRKNVSKFKLSKRYDNPSTHNKK